MFCSKINLLLVISLSEMTIKDIQYVSERVNLMLYLSNSGTFFTLCWLCTAAHWILNETMRLKC